MSVTAYPDRGGIAPGGILTFDTYAALVAAYPSAKVGTTAWVKRILGTGYFQCMWNGSRWEVAPGHSIVSDSTGYPLTASGTSLVVLASCTIPGGLIGSGEEWEFSMGYENSTVFAGSGDTGALRINGSVSLVSPGTLTAASRMSGCYGRFLYKASKFYRPTGGAVGVSWNNQAQGYALIDMSLPQVADVTMTPGAVGNTSTITRWSIGRFA